jgi:hypothetical protein
MGGAVLAVPRGLNWSAGAILAKYASPPEEIFCHWSIHTTKMQGRTIHLPDCKQRVVQVLVNHYSFGRDAYWPFFFESALCWWFWWIGHAERERRCKCALCWIWDLGSAVLQGTLRICMPAHPLHCSHRAQGTLHVKS